jgi:hypothetical protein
MRPSSGGYGSCDRDLYLGWETLKNPQMNIHHLEDKLQRWLHDTHGLTPSVVPARYTRGNTSVQSNCPVSKSGRRVTVVSNPRRLGNCVTSSPRKVHCPSGPSYSTWGPSGGRTEPGHGRLGKVHNPGFALTLYQGKTVGLLREQGRCGDFMLPHGLRPPDHGVCRACGSPANAVHPTRHAYPRGGMYHPQWPGNLTQLWHLWGRFGVVEGSERAKE